MMEGRLPLWRKTLTLPLKERNQTNTLEKNHYHLDALNQSVQAIQDLDLTTDVSSGAGSGSEDASTDANSDSGDASADTKSDASSATTEDTAAEASKTSDDSTPEGDYTPYSYTDVYRNGDDLTVIPNGQLNGSTVILRIKILQAFWIM